MKLAAPLEKYLHLYSFAERMDARWINQHGTLRVIQVEDGKMK